ncbi:MAG: tripartite tricarboxylate transporter substrate binding protein [Betaproteobacteria bacterium]|nr:tripartite tricarboxylate transporter substrate binding protein [Betaproteobacteria bacterium]
MRCKASVLLCAVLWLPGPAALAAGSVPANYPLRPIRVVVPQSPGGSTDLTTRLVTPQLSERLGQSMVVDNRPGAGSMLGTDLVAKATPDGYTLLVAPSSITIIPSMYRKVPFDPVKDFAPLAMLSSYPNLVVVHPSVPANSVKELIALAKAKPGTLNFASGGIGTPTQLGAELFKSMAGIDIVHVPYKGGGPAVAALIGGQVHLYFGPIATVLAHAKSGKLRALAVTSAKRMVVAPEVPSVAEAGLPGFEQTTWNGLLAPARTPPAVIKKLNSELNAVLNMPAMRERFASEGVDLGGVSSAEFAARIKSDIAKWAAVIRQAGIKPE